MILAHYETREAWQAALEALRTHGGLQLQAYEGDEPEPFSHVEVRFVAPAGELARAEGRVVHIAPGLGHLSLTFEGEDMQALLDTAFEDAGDVDDDDAPETEEALWKRYPELSKAEKIKLARRGKREARRLVLRDRDQSLHIHVLNNPGITPKEVASLLRSGAVNGQLVRRVLQRADLSHSRAVVEALVFNPQTPIKVAVDLVPRLSPEVLRRIAKRGNLRTPIVKAARKKVLRR